MSTHDSENTQSDVMIDETVKMSIPRKQPRIIVNKWSLSIQIDRNGH